MYKLCKTEQSATRQQQLEQGLLNAMLIKHYEHISVSDLCDVLDIPRKSFYRYFSGKDGALHALIDHTLLRFESFTLTSRRYEKRTLLSELEAFFEFWVVNRLLLDALERSNLSGILIQRSVLHATSDSVLPRRFLPDDSLQMQKQITMFGVCGLMSMVLTWHHDGYNCSSAEMARIAARLLGKPLFPNTNSFL